MVLLVVCEIDEIFVASWLCTDKEKRSSRCQAVVGLRPESEQARM